MVVPRSLERLSQLPGELPSIDDGWTLADEVPLTDEWSQVEGELANCAFGESTCTRPFEDGEASLVVPIHWSDEAAETSAPKSCDPFRYLDLVDLGEELIYEPAELGPCLNHRFDLSDVVVAHGV